MPDITKCNGTDCIAKDKCLRYTSITDNKYQSWSSFYNLKKDCLGKCAYFLENKKGEI